jgi:hypothetical protein
METVFSVLIGLSVTVFFVRRHVKAQPPEKATTRPARNKSASATKAA